ncbi:hypothetical protein F5148DRAFT_1155022, partial [Russula earlei]
MLFLLACKKLGNKEDASDIVQETFIEIWDKREKLQAFEIYLEQISQQYEEIPDALLELENNYLTLQEVIDTSIQLMPEKMRKVLLMHLSGNYTIDQIASNLDVSRNTVKSHLYVSMQKDELSILLEKYLKGKCTPEELQLLWKWIWQVDLAEGIRLDEKEENAISDPYHGKIAGKGDWYQKKTFVYTAAAAVIALLLSGSVIWLNNQNNNNNSNQPVAMVMIAADGKHIKKILLPDSTEVVLNQNASLTYSPDTYGTAIRKVTLEGEGYFEVHRDTAHPFIVQSGSILTQALGTGFNIEYYQGESEIR